MPIKIFVLDDDKETIELMQNALTRVGYSASYFSEVDEFEKALDAFPTIVILDYYLGSRTGVDIMRKVKDKHPIMTFIITSSQMSTNQLLDIINVGWGCYFVDKDGNFGDFINELTNKIDTARASMLKKLKGFVEVARKEEDIKMEALEVLTLIDKKFK